MSKAYSDDLRVRVVRAVDAGASRRSVAAKFEVSVSFVIRLAAQWRASGSAKVRGTGGRPLHRRPASALTLPSLCCIAPRTASVVLALPCRIWPIVPPAIHGGQSPHRIAGSNS
jgi:hypothetical protein